MNFIISFFSNTIVAFLILICIVVIAHELGHFLVGRFLGIAVEEFSIGFGPRAFSFKIGQTEYRVNWLPLGGYIRFYGADTDATVPPEKREQSILHAKLYKRMCVSFAGPFANFVLSFVIMGFLYSFGINKEPAVFSVLNGSVAYTDGLRSGDRVLDINGKKISDWSDLMQKISTSPNQALNFTVEREGETKVLTVTPQSAREQGVDGITQSVGRIGITPFFSAPVIAPWQNQFFDEIGIKAGDKIISVNNVKINYLNDFLRQIEIATQSTSDISIAKRILNHEIPTSLTITVLSNNTQQTLAVDLNTNKMNAWAKTVLANSQQNVHSNWAQSVAAAELTIRTFENDKTSNTLKASAQSLSECGLTQGDTIRQMNQGTSGQANSFSGVLFTSQIDLYSWLSKATTAINKNVAQFKNNSLPTNIFVTDSLGKEKTYSCFLSVQSARSEVSGEQLGIDFPVKFMVDPILYPSVKIKGANVFESVKLGFKSVVSQTTFIYSGLKKLFSGNVPLSTLGGPIAIAGFAGDAAKAGLETFLLAMSLMSINIGIFNLLPFPILDGGTLLLQIVEGIYGKPIPQKMQMFVIRVGLALLLTLFILVFYNDITRLFHR